jgi:hypothetical protein
MILPPPSIGRPTEGALGQRGPIGLSLNWIFERHALRVIFLKPFVSGVGASKDLEMVDVADLLASVDVNPTVFMRMPP